MRLILLIVLSIVTGNFYSQKDFQWEAIDTVGKTKDQLYTDTKLFIAETWTSAKEVIQTDDKDGGLIVVKGISTYYSNFQMNPHDFAYQYTAKFFVKDNKYKVVIDNIVCTRHDCRGSAWPLIQPTEDTSKKKEGMPAEKLTAMMNQLKRDMQYIVDSYQKTIKKPSW